MSLTRSRKLALRELISDRAQFVDCVRRFLVGVPGDRWRELTKILRGLLPDHRVVVQLCRPITLQAREVTQHCVLRQLSPAELFEVTVSGSTLPAGLAHDVLLLML